MMLKKNISFIVLGLTIIILATFLSNYFSFSPILNACVNTTNGHVAFAYYEHSRDGVMVKSFDADGKKIVSWFFDTSGGNSIYLVYENDFLVVYPRSKSSNSQNLFYYFDEEGNLSNKETFEESSSRVQSIRNTEWMDWEKSSQGKSYVLNNNTYFYEESSFFLRLIGRGSCRFYIKNQEGIQIDLYFD